MNDEERLKEAIDLATEAHKGQLRKYTDTPYIEHPLEVLSILERYYPECTIEQKQAAVLHDTVEDTSVLLEDILLEFGTIVHQYVGYLTDVSKPQDGNRATRKLLDREHMSKAPPEVQIIKVADILSNSKSIFKYDKKFSEVYLRECLSTLLVMDESLHEEPLYVNTINLLEDTLERI